MIKKTINNLYDFIEFIKIIFLGKLIGRHYIVNSLKYCRKSNINRILLYYGAKVGKNIHYKGSIVIDNYSSEKKIFKNLHIGDNCYIGYEVYFDLANKIIIENDVVISARTMIVTHADVGDRKMNRYYKRVSLPVKIHEGSWIGVQSVILTGVTINKFAVIGANSTVIKDVKSYTMVSGSPAVFKKEIK